MGICRCAGRKTLCLSKSPKRYCSKKAPHHDSRRLTCRCLSYEFDSSEECISFSRAEQTHSKAKAGRCLQGAPHSESPAGVLRKACCWAPASVEIVGLLHSCELDDHVGSHICIFTNHTELTWGQNELAHDRGDVGILDFWFVNNN